LIVVPYFLTFEELRFDLKPAQVVVESVASVAFIECFHFVRIQDHGELWTRAPELEVVEAEYGVALTTCWKRVERPHSFEPTIPLAAGSERMQFEYRITNDGDSPVQWIGSAHPWLVIVLVTQNQKGNFLWS
jgi:hypothetical protein